MILGLTLVQDSGQEREKKITLNFIIVCLKPSKYQNQNIKTRRKEWGTKSRACK